MPSLKEYNNKIGSMKNTAKVTKTMKMVATSKFRRAQDAQKSSKLYAQSLDALVGRVAAAVDRLQGGHGGGSRDDKHRDDSRRDDRPQQPEPTPEPEPPSPSPGPRARKLSRPVVAAGVAAVAVVAIAGVALAGKGGDDPPAAASGTTNTSGCLIA